MRDEEKDFELMVKVIAASIIVSWVLCAIGIAALFAKLLG